MRYCSYCLKPCKVVLRNDSFDHAFGTQKVVTEHPDCHPDDDVLTREERNKEVQERWDFRRIARNHYKEPPLTKEQENRIFTEIFDQYIRRVA